MAKTLAKQFKKNLKNNSVAIIAGFILLISFTISAMLETSFAF
jgi:hypothetical protein